ncbi:TRAP-type C4-dicarboxylate transport system substrate-binding protein [Sphaerotilus hippei]|uniref:TRAP-type C4-dicarboxylate transport system substrate-binding protein n=1 Tax=Sphaerotilus hippei TaxID=744406 RepID=A0A318H5V5_9BURK|nr:TRAP transporter substrate-binding protein [Sphaerotilus hippei]PXW97631.1 TRAP-type C4-dicarboxylate transport system substrate-binding protein [Sphaerotilus hippei]
MNKMLKTLAAAALAAVISPAAMAEEVTLKVHFFLPATSLANTLFITPWCERIAKESAQRLKCQIFPSMQLGGTPPQLFEQARDGVADVVWTLPGYTAGRFPSIEVFELPFMMQNPEATSKALWDYTQKYSQAEFKDVKPLAFHVHGDGVFHMSAKPIKTMADLKGLKLRAPTRMTNRFLAMLGATPVGMPVPQVGDALSKGVIDGAVVPYEVVPSVKIQELVKYHSETDPTEPAFYTSTFVFAMNKAKYESLPADLKKVIDNNSGQALSGLIGKAFLQADAEGKKLTTRNTTNVIPAAELASWKKLGQNLADSWVSDMNGKGQPGAQMLGAARSLITQHATPR